LSAAQEALRHPTPEGAAALADALQREKDPAIRQVVVQALATARLAYGNKAERLAAVSDLAHSADPEIRSLLLRQLAEAGTDAEFKHAIDGALRSIEFRLQLAGIAETLFQ